MVHLGPTKKKIRSLVSKEHAYTRMFKNGRNAVSHLGLSTAGYTQGKKKSCNLLSIPTTSTQITSHSLKQNRNFLKNAARVTKCKTHTEWDEKASTDQPSV